MIGWDPRCKFVSMAYTWRCPWVIAFWFRLHWWFGADLNFAPRNVVWDCDDFSQLSLSCHFPVTFLSLSCHFPLLSCHCQGLAEGRCGPNCPRYTTNGCECAKSWVQEGHEEPGGVGAISINLLPFWNHFSSMQGIDIIDTTLPIGCLKKEGHRGSCWVQLV